MSEQLKQKTLALQIPDRRTDAMLNLLIDRSGIEFLDGGEWQHASIERRAATKVGRSS